MTMWMLARAGALVIALTFVGIAGAQARYASLVIDAATGDILHERESDQLRHPASLTKLMTLYLIFEAIEAKQITFSTRWAVSDRAASQPPTKLGLERFDYITVRDAVLGLITRSANDAAVVAAEGLAGSVEKFAQMMTRKARALGMSRTTFENASGLPDPDQFTTARDMATLARAIIFTFPNHYPLFATSEFIFNGRVNANHNRLMSYYQGMDGLKTGFINSSGFNLVASAVRNGRRLIGVVLGGPSPGQRDHEMARLLDAAFGTPGREAPRVAERLQPLKPTAAPALVLTAPQLVLKPPPVQAQGDGEPAWGVQIGTFNRAEVAKFSAEQAMRVARKALDGGDVEVAPVSVGKVKKFRSRVMGLSEPQARAACKVLGPRKDFDCTIVPPVLIKPAARVAATN